MTRALSSQLIALVPSACVAAEVVWGFSGVITRAESETHTPDLRVGATFTGTIHFNSEPFGPSLLSENHQGYAWTGERIGIKLTAAGLDFSTSRRSEAFLELTKANDYFSFPIFTSTRRISDRLIIIGGSEVYGPPPPPPGEIHVDYEAYRRNIFIELHDFDRTSFSDVSLPLRPFDINEFELRKIIANFSVAGASLGHAFHGEINQLYLVPEPVSALLFVLGFPALFLRLGLTPGKSGELDLHS